MDVFPVVGKKKQKKKKHIVKNMSIWVLNLRVRHQLLVKEEHNETNVTQNEVKTEVKWLEIDLKNNLNIY